MKYDAVVVGGGPGGYEAALQVARLGGKAAVVEKDSVGGVCTNRGCIPTKALAAACEAYDTVSRAGRLGVKAEAEPDVQAMFKHRDRVSAVMRKGVEKLLEDAGVEVVAGTGSLKSAHEVEVGGRILEAKNIVVATGSEPTGLPGIEIDHEYVISGDDAAVATEAPGKVVIVGGGFIGCEYAGIYGRLGCEVTLAEALPRVLAAEDDDVSETVHRMLSKHVKIVTDTKVGSVDKEKMTVDVGGEQVDADVVLLAVGRKPVFPDGLDRVGVVHGRDGIRVDSHMRTSVDNIYAVGDVAEGLNLAHVAYAGAETAAGNIMGGDAEADFMTVPWCVFTLPEVGRVGVTERDAEGDVRVGRSDYIGNGKARCMRERDGFCKVIVDESGAIVGVHMIGAHASDLIGEATLAVKHKLTARQVADTIHPHPTLTEVFREACTQLR